MTVLNVWPNLIQNEGDNVGLYSQKEHITLVDGLFVTCCQVHSHFLQEKSKKDRGTCHENCRCSDVKRRGRTDITITMWKLLTLSPNTVGRSVSGELAVILWVAITPGDRWKQRNK